MDGEELRQQVAENRDWSEKLTKRNEQYIFDLKKAYKASNMSDEDIEVALHNILPQLVEGQKTGKTARQLFGTVSDALELNLEQKKAAAGTVPWMMWLDNTFLFFAMLSILTGVMSIFSKTNTMANGIVSLILTSMAGGIIFYFLYIWIYQYEKPGADKSKKPKMWKSLLMLAGAMVVWIIVYSGSMFLPQILNPVLPGPVTVVLGGLVLAFRFWFKKKNNIQGSFFTR